MWATGNMSPQQMDTILDKLDLPNLLSIASSLHETATAVEIIKSRINKGGYNIVIPILFDDGTIWAARILLEEANEYWINPCILNLTLLQTLCPEVPAPHFKGTSRDCGNGVGTCYVFMDWINGHQLKWTPTFPERKERNIFLDSLATCLLDLWSNPVCDKGIYTVAGTAVGEGFQSASAWAVVKLDQGLHENFQQENESNIINTLIQISLVPNFISRRFDTAPFVLSHDDLSGANIMVNDEFEVQGIVDWDFAEVMPLQFAVRIPHLIANEPGDDPSEQEDPYLEDREYFVEAIRKLEYARWKSRCWSNMLKSCEERQFFVTSLLVAESAEVFWQRHCVWTVETLGDALGELDRFLERYPSYIGNECIARTRNSILKYMEVGQAS